MLLDGLLGSTQCVWCFVDGTRAHEIGLKTMQGLLSSSLWVILATRGDYFDLLVEIVDRGIEEREGDFMKLAMESQV